jgi:hypothetical protein
VKCALETLMEKNFVRRNEGGRISWTDQKGYAGNSTQFFEHFSKIENVFCFRCFCFEYLAI